MKKITTFLSIIFVLLVAISVSAKEKSEYRHYLALGIADTHISNGDNPMSPLFAWYWFLEDFEDSDLYGNVGITTTKFYFKFGKKTDKYFAGVKPFLNHTTYGAYYYYENGEEKLDRTFKGNRAGIELFFEKYILKNLLSMKVAYIPNYYFYMENEKVAFDLPENHVEHKTNLQLKVGNVEKKDLRRIKHGVFANIRHEFARRVGYDTFVGYNDNSSVKTTNKYYLDLGAKQDIYGSIQYNVDRNNAEKIGYMNSTNGVMPGYYNSEFNHDKYLISRTQIGFPLGFWSSRIETGFNVLYMPKENNVIGLGNYSKKVYKSVSLALSFKAVDVLPIFLW